MSEFVTTTVFDRIVAAHLTAGKRLIVNEGGTRSTKTFSTIQFLIYIVCNSKDPVLISIVSESFPHLRRGAIRDFRKIMGGNFNEDHWNKSESIYDFGKERYIEFFSADQSSKLRGGTRDYLFMNEVNNIGKESFDEADVRTRVMTLVDFNPVAEFFIHEMRNLPFVAWIHSTYLDALQVLDRSVVDNILSRKDRDPNWWRVYGLGLVGKLEGLIHPNFEQEDALPERFDREVFGLDFGYSIDPATLIQNRIVGDSVHSRELFYETGLTNQAIAAKFEEFGVRKNYDVIIADCAEPKSIDEIAAFGYDIRPCAGGHDAKNAGIQKVNQFKQYWTKDSLNAIKEQRNWRWEQNAQGKFTDKAMDDWDHAMLARVYAVATVPAPKVLPVRVAEVDKVLDFKKMDSTTTLLCSIWTEPTLKTSASLASWNTLMGKLNVFGEFVFQSPEPNAIIKRLTEFVKTYTREHLQNLKSFEIWGNSAFFDEWGGDLNSAFSAAGLYVRENISYNEIGAIAISTNLLNLNKIVILSTCPETVRQVSTWRITKKPEPGNGLARAMLGIVSTLYEAGKIRQEPPKKLKEYSDESMEAQKHIEELVKRGLSGERQDYGSPHGWAMG